MNFEEVNDALRLEAEARRLEAFIHIKCGYNVTQALAQARVSRRHLIRVGHSKKNVYKWYKAFARYMRASFKKPSERKSSDYKHLKANVTLTAFGIGR